MRDHSIHARRQPAIPAWESALGLAALFLPGAGFVWGLTQVSGHPGYVDLQDWRSVPWMLWVIGVCGTAATAAGVLDWHYHVTGRRLVSRKERHGELVALGLGGAPLFALMMLASASHDSSRYLGPIVAVAIFTVVMICIDELVYHRRSCTRYETALHRTLVFGNGLAFLAWFHWLTTRA